ncbi:cation diffusion facilitator family transporter [Antarctobacter jejuensis]|uniref:cation diffusion facilitator family transporter n=1 Tax=Antarctobacter jejuensis TaxID=1439938 RepID=UPI003FD56F8C
MPRAVRIALGSIAIGLIVLAIKTLAWWLTGSVALLSDALESIVNVATAVAAFVAVRIAAQPADADHPFGHHKAEYFSAVMEGVLIVVAAVFILNEAWSAWNAPVAIDAPWTGLALVALASGINAVWAFLLIREGRRLRSPALAADGRHLMTDVISSAGVAVGVVAAVLTGALWLDALLAALVAVNILWSGWQVIRGSVAGLMDVSVPETDLEQMRTLISENAAGAVEAHDLRARHAGAATFIEFHLVVPGDMTVDEAHDICDRIEAALKAGFDECRITIHVEPDHKAKHSGIIVL